LCIKSTVVLSIGMYWPCGQGSPPCGATTSSCHVASSCGLLLVSFGCFSLHVRVPQGMRTETLQKAGKKMGRGDKGEETSSREVRGQVLKKGLRGCAQRLCSSHKGRWDKGKTTTPTRNPVLNGSGT